MFDGNRSKEVNADGWNGGSARTATLRNLLEGGGIGDKHKTESQWRLESRRGGRG